MLSFCEDSLIGGSNIHVKKGFHLVLLPDYFCSFRYLVKSSRPFLSHDNLSANLGLSLLQMAATTTTVSLRKYNGKILAINSCNNYTVGVCHIVM